MINLTKILIVEDNDSVRLSLSLMLEIMGYIKPDTALSGEDGINKALENTYDLILMDIGLPDIDGIEASVEIRKIPRNKDVIIIAVTGHGKDVYQKQCLASGMNDVLSKPFHKDELRKMLEKYISKNGDNNTLR